MASGASASRTATQGPLCLLFGRLRRGRESHTDVEDLVEGLQDQAHGNGRSPIVPAWNITQFHSCILADVQFSFVQYGAEARHSPPNLQPHPYKTWRAIVKDNLVGRF